LILTDGFDIVSRDRVIYDRVIYTSYRDVKGGVVSRLRADGYPRMMMFTSQQLLVVSAETSEICQIGTAGYAKTMPSHSAAAESVSRTHQRSIPMPPIATTFQS
jgi:hypothetical protein